MFYNNGYNQDWSTLKKLIWLRGNPATGQMGTDLTVSGTPPISLPNSLGKPLKAWEVGLEPYQDLHGYDSPWPAGGGKNKFNPAEAQSGKWINTTTGAIENSSSIYWITGYIPVKSGDTVYCSPSKGSSRNAWFNSDKTQSTYQTYGGGGAGVIAPADGYFVATVTNDRFSIDSEFVVTINNSDLTYSPYSNICPIHGTDKVTVWTAGKNLYSKEDSVYNVPVYATDGTTASYPDVAVWWMPAKPNTQYTVSCNHNEKTFYVRLINCDSNKGFINRVGYAYTENDLPLTITTPANCEWVQIAINQYGTDHIALNDWEVMVVEGSTAADYEPYNGSQTVLTLPQTVYTGTIGSEGGESRWGEVDLGTLTWHSNSLGLYSMGLKGIAKTYPNGQPNHVLFENYQSKPSKAGGTYVNEPNVISLNANGYLYTSATTTPTGKCVYELIDPVQFSLTAPPIPTPTGTAATWATAEDGTVESMEVTYVGKV